MINEKISLFGSKPRFDAFTGKNKIFNQIKNESPVFPNHCTRSRFTAHLMGDLARLQGE